MLRVMVRVRVRVWVRVRVRVRVWFGQVCLTLPVCRIILCADIQLEPGTEQQIRAITDGGYEQNSGGPRILEG